MSLIPIIGVPFHVIKVVTLVSGITLMFISVIRRQSYLVPIFNLRALNTIQEKSSIANETEMSTDNEPSGAEFVDDDVMLVSSEDDST